MLVDGVTDIIPVDQLYAAIGLGQERVASRTRRYAQLIERVMTRHGWSKKRRRLRRHDLHQHHSDNRELVYEKGTDDICLGYDTDRRCFVTIYDEKDELEVRRVLGAIPSAHARPQ